MDGRVAAGRPLARWARLGGVAVGGVLLAVAGGALLIPLAARVFVRGIVMGAAGCVWLATSLSTGVSPWTMAATVWRTATGAVSSPMASAVLWGFVILGALALYWLQRLLGSEEE
jgi:hypothetical protein